MPEIKIGSLVWGFSAILLGWMVVCLARRVQISGFERFHSVLISALIILLITALFSFNLASFFIGAVAGVLIVVCHIFLIGGHQDDVSTKKGGAS